MSERDPHRTVAALLRGSDALDGTFNPGDVTLMVDEPGGPPTAYGFGCPGCASACILHLGNGPTRHTWQVTAGDASKPETVTLAPSIHHTPEHGGCGWHGYLTRGVFTPCGTPDPHAGHRRFLVELLEETLAAVVAGRIDGAFLVTHQSETHPDGCAWATAFSGNVDFVHQLGALELAKADLLHRANAPKT